MRKTHKLSQSELAKLTGINRALLSRIENRDFVPPIDQLLTLSENIGFNYTDILIDVGQEPETNPPKANNSIQYKIAVAGTGYVGLSLAVLLSQHNSVTAVDIIPDKVDLINQFISPIHDEYIEKFFEEEKTEIAHSVLQQQQMAPTHTKSPIILLSQFRLIMILRKTSSTVLLSKTFLK